MTIEKQEIAQSNLKGKSIDCRLCNNKFHLACMKRYSRKKMLDKPLQWKKSSKLGFVCDDCLRLIENDLLAEKEDASSFVAGFSNNDKIKSIRDCALAKDSKILCDQVLQNNFIEHGTSMIHNNNDNNNSNNERNTELKEIGIIRSFVDVSYKNKTEFTDESINFTNKRKSEKYKTKIQKNIIEKKMNEVTWFNLVRYVMFCKVHLMNWIYVHSTL